MNGVNSSIFVPYERCVLIILLMVIYFESDCDGKNVDTENTTNLSQKAFINNGRLENLSKSLNFDMKRQPIIIFYV